ncbi:ABC transporter permease [Brachybacterium sp. DNPG3]
MTTGVSASGPVPEVPDPIDRRYEAAEVEKAVAVNGLTQMGIRPPLVSYIRDLWNRRAFIGVLATSKASAQNQNTYLGQVWALLSPTLNAFVYVIIFGFILQIGRAGISNTIAFIVVGVFMFRFFERSVMAGSHSLDKNMNLIRSVQFPRAVLPAAGVLAELTVLGPALVVMIVISYLSGFLPSSGAVTIKWSWLLLIPAILLFWMFSTGAAFIVARMVAAMPDLDNLLPHLLRVLMYCSGVIFSIDRFLGDFSWGWIFAYQPVAVYLYLCRSTLLDEPSSPPDPTMWLMGAIWGVVFLVVGFLVFWKGEETYGRN